MATVKFYALCCRNIEALKRHQISIPIDDLVIVINTLDEGFKNAAVEYCTGQGIEHYITESNGTPSQGKNSVLDIFLQSDNDYMVLIDGDDLVTPYGVWLYKEIANLASPPDAVALQNQVGVRIASDVDHGVAELLGDFVIAGRCFTRIQKWWDVALSGELIYVPEGDDFAHNLRDVHTRWARHCAQYLQANETHHRVVFKSRRAAEYRYDPLYKCGEDTLLYLDLKHESMSSDFVLRHIDDFYPSYIYDIRVGGVIEKANDHDDDDNFLGYDHGWLAWMKKLVEAYDALEEQGKMHTEKVEVISVLPHNYQSEIRWPEGFDKDLLGLKPHVIKKTF